SLDLAETLSASDASDATRGLPQHSVRRSSHNSRKGPVHMPAGQRRLRCHPARRRIQPEPWQVPTRPSEPLPPQYPMRVFSLSASFLALEKTRSRAHRSEKRKKFRCSNCDGRVEQIFLESAARIPRRLTAVH